MTTDVEAEVEAMEQELRDKDITVVDALRGTGIALSTWQRWKRGQVPLLTTWELARANHERLIRRDYR
jgi:hypothetical protein